MKNISPIYLFPRARKSMAFFALLAVVILAGSCGTVKYSTYFQTIPKDTTLQKYLTKDLELKIQQKDLLSITVSSLNKEIDDQFNSASSPNSVNGVQQITGYLVDQQGNIQLHRIGSIHVEGLTRKELQDKMQSSLLPYMKEPIVNVQFLNHKVTIMGVVNNPQVINMPNEQISLIDVIVSSGDMKEEADRSDVIVIRDEGQQKKIKHVNLQDHSIFSSSWYYLQPNDIVYVQPLKAKTNTEEKKRNLQATVSLIASGVSLVVIILNSLLK